MQDDGDEVGPVAHVALAQQPGELEPHVGQALAQPVHALARLDETARRVGELGVGGVELGLRLREPALEHGDLARDLALELAEPRGGARQRALLGLAGADPVAQRALALAARGGGHDERGEDGDEERDAGHGGRPR